MKKLIPFLALLLMTMLVMPNSSSATVLMVTKGATNITGFGATLNATLTIFNEDTSVRFKYTSVDPGVGANCSSLTNASETSSTNYDFTGGIPVVHTEDLHVDISGLSPTTKYFYCPINENNNIFGSIMSFTTDAYTIPPITSGVVGTVVTMPIKLGTLTDTEALFHGKLLAGSGTIYAYFRYSEVEIPPIFCNEVFGSDMRSIVATVPNESGLVEPGDFYALVDGLQPDTQYAFCAVVSNHGKSKNNTSIKYGEPIVFRTLPCQDCPHTTVETKPAVIIDSNSAALKGNYGSTKYTKTHFEYVEIPDDLNIPLGDWISTPITDNTPGYRKMSYTLTDLKPFTVYNFRAVAETTGPEERFEGIVLQFRTPKFNVDFGLSEEDEVDTSCFDGVQNGDETGIDTGGECDGFDGTCESVGLTGTPPDCVPDGTDLSCGIGFTGTPPDCVPEILTCEELGMTGTQPNCEIPAQTCADLGLVGTFPDCTSPPLTCEDVGMTGTWPNGCVIPPLSCENMGMIPDAPGDMPPKCHTPPLTCENMGMIPDAPGDMPPKCHYSGGTGQTCADFGLEPNEPGDVPPKCKFPTGPGGTGQTCADFGLEPNEPGDVPPSCKQPDPTCESLGMEGDFPECSSAVTSCQQMGLGGNWPDCIYVGDGVGDPGDDGNQGDDGNGNNGNGNNGDNGNGNNGNGNNGDNGNGGCLNDKDCGGIPDSEDSDIDGDGVPNVIDPDTNGDGVPNIADPDDDGDGIPDLVDNSPTGRGTLRDYDGSGISNNLDSDMDGDGIPNACDPDTDGDGKLNINDPDMDNDNIPNEFDPTPTGASGGTCPVLGVGDEAMPLFDDIVRHREGIEHVFARRIVRSVPLQVRYGYQTGTNLTQFAYDLAHTLAKTFGYVDKSGKEIRVSKPDVSAYSLRISGNKTYVYEYYKNKIIDIRIIKNNVRVFKTPSIYEYLFKKKF